MNKKSIMILAAGYGTRMQEYTKEIPKPLLPIAGYPLLTYSLFMTYLLNANHIVINVHYKKDKIIDFIKDYPYSTIYLSQEEKILGTAGGIAFAIFQNFLEDYFLVLNSDTIFFPDFDPFEDIYHLKEYSINNFFYLQKKTNREKNEKGFRMNKISNTLFSIELESKDALESNHNYFYTGLSIFHRSFFNYYLHNIKNKDNYNINIENIFKKELSELFTHNSLYGRIYTGIRIDSGNKKEYEFIQTIYKKPEDIIPLKYHQYWYQFLKGWKI